MKKLQKILSMFIITLALFLLLPTQAQAKELWETDDWESKLWKKWKETEDGYTYAEYKNEIYILYDDIRYKSFMGELDPSVDELQIPEQIDGKNVVAYVGSSNFKGALASRKIVLPKYLRYFEFEIYNSYGTFTQDIPLEYEVAEGNTHFKVEDDVLYSADGKVLVACTAFVDRSFRVPDGVEKINRYAFSGSKVTKVTLSDTVTEIGDYAFWASKLEKIKLSKKLKKIGESAFDYSNIRSITIPKSVKIIEEGAFCANPDLKKVTFEKGSKLKILEKYTFAETGIKTIKLPSGLKEIKARALGDCKNLRKVEIPATVTKISDTAFGGKDEKLNLTIKAKKNSFAYRYAKNRKKRGIKLG